MILKQLTPQILSEVGFPNCKSVNFATLAESVKMTEVFTTGKIGRNGIKVHAFNTSYFEHKGEKYLSYYYAGCGAETYKSGTAATYDTDISKVTCQKCLDRIAKGL